MRDRVPARLRPVTVAAATAAAVTLGVVMPSVASSRVDTTAPSATLSVKETVNATRQHTALPSHWINPARSGSFTVNVAAADRESGIASVTFPGLWGSGTVVDSTAPFSRSYSWPAGATGADLSPVVKNRAGLTTRRTVAVRTDATAPAPGATLAYSSGRIASPETSVAFTAGPGDAGSGLAVRRLVRVALGGGTCAAASTVTVSTNATASPVVDAGLIPGACYRYRLAEVDRVGNSTVLVGSTQVRVNRAPSALDLAVTTSEDEPVAVDLAGHDADGDQLSYTVTGRPGRGSFSGTVPNLVYTPHRDAHGSDSITFTVSDGMSADSASVDVTVGSGNDGPVARASAVATTEDTGVGFDLSATDVDGDPLSFSVVSPPAHGTLSGSGARRTYTPDADWHGTDELLFRASDGAADSQTVPVTLSVTPVNDAPVASALAVVTTAGTAVPVTLAGSDRDGDTLTSTVTEPPAKGTLTGTGETLTYVPDAGTTGTDTFAYTVSDGALTSAPAAVSVTVEAPVLVGPSTPSGFEASGLDGAGFQNVVAVDPHGSGVVITGADVSGFHRSTDWGRTFRTANEGVGSLTALHVAGVTFSPTVKGLVYAAVGHRGAGGGLLVSTDYGQSWSLRSTAPQFSGSNNKVTGLPATHPRSTGDLLAVDGGRGLLYAATFQQGVMRSSDDGRTWTTLGLAGSYLRSLAIDPEDPDVVYASTYGNGVHRTTDASGAGTFSKLTTSPTHAEELAVVDGTVYVAGGARGVFSSADGGSTWKQLGAGVVRTDGPTWLSVDAYRDAATGKHVVLVGADKPTKVTSTQADSLLRSTDGGATWTSLTRDETRIHDEVGGPGGSAWWLLRTQPWMALGEGSYTASHIVVSPSDPQRVYVAGRSGLWSSSNGGTDWYPMVDGLQVTINKQVVTDPNVPGRVYVANTDWITLVSTDGGRTMAQNRPPAGDLALALALDTATTPGTLYAAVGERDANTHGEIYLNADPATSRTWTTLGLGALTGGKRPVALAVQRVGGQPVVLAAVEAGGIWRHAGGTWTQVSTGAMASGSMKFGSLSWAPGSTDAYLHDPATGVWASTDAGRSWTKVWAKAAAGTQATTTVAADPTTLGRVYVSVVRDGVYRLDGARSAGTTVVTKVTGVGRPGPLAVAADGSLTVTENASWTTKASLKVSRDAGATFSTTSDSAYRGAALFPFALALGSTGETFLALNGNGVLRRS